MATPGMSVFSRENSIDESRFIKSSWMGTKSPDIMKLFANEYFQRYVAVSNLDSSRKTLKGQGLSEYSLFRKYQRPV